MLDSTGPLSAVNLTFPSSRRINSVDQNSVSACQIYSDLAGQISEP